MAKQICTNCGADVNGGSTCSRCQRTGNAPRVLTSQNINEMLWYDGKKAWE